MRHVEAMVDERLGELIVVAQHQKHKHFKGLCALEHGSLVLAELLNILLVVCRRLAPVKLGQQVVRDVEVFLVDVVFTCGELCCVARVSVKTVREEAQHKTTPNIPSISVRELMYSFSGSSRSINECHVQLMAARKILIVHVGSRSMKKPNLKSNRVQMVHQAKYTDLPVCFIHDSFWLLSILWWWLGWVGG